MVYYEIIAVVNYEVLFNDSAFIFYSRGFYVYMINIGMKIATCLLCSVFVGFRCIFE